MKKILLPTDFSKNAQKAIDYALALFENEECIFYLMHAYHDVPSASANKMTAKEGLIQLVENLQAKTNPKHRFEWILETDSVISLINRTIIEKEVDYVIVGTKGSSAIKEIFMGSVTLSIVKHLINCPLIAVPAEYNHKGIQEMVFITDFKHVFKTSGLAPLIEISILSNATLNIAYIKTMKILSDEQKLNKELLRKALKGTKHLFFKLEPQESVTTTVFELKKENKKIGMVALLNTKHGFLERLFRESVIKNLVIRTQVPLLVLPIVE